MLQDAVFLRVLYTGHVLEQDWTSKSKKVEEGSADFSLTFN
jgi:hypothetical protein